MEKSFFSKLGFWQQLVFFFTCGILVLTIATSIVLTITANNSLKSQLVNQSLYLTESLARQARLSLLYQSPEEAQEVLDIAMQYPDVSGVRITTEKKKILAEKGNIPNFLRQSGDESEANLIEELDEYLIFLSPVITQIEQDYVLEDELSSDNVPSETIGYLTLVVSKDSLSQIWTKLLRSNLLVSTIVAITLALLLLLLTRRLTNPLRYLSQVMHRAEKGELNLRASFKGPRDIEEMQTAFNTMMASLERQTVELKIARDDALESAKIKSEFAANVSHELRTPMNSVLGMLDILSFMRLTAQQMEYVETAKLSAENLLALIDDILSYVRSDTGNLVIDEGPCDLNNLVEEVIQLLSPQALKKKIDIGYLVKLDNVNIIADRQRLRQVLINLLGNSVKFTESGEVSLSIDSLPESQTLRFTISDTGIGIDERALDKIFDAFTQEDSTTTKKYGGTGLGLAICKQFVDLMGGKLSVESKKGFGSTFTILLPLKPDHKVSLQNKEKSYIEGKNIVIVDDSSVVLNFIKDWCDRQGANVYCLNNIVSLIDLLKSFDEQKLPLDVLFIDEDLLGLRFDEIVSMAQEHTSCEEISAISLVNPWEKAHNSSLFQYSVLEKPLTNTRLNDFFNKNKTEHAIKENKHNYAFLHSKVLVVDDNKSNCLVAGGMLKQIGCEYEIAHNGEEAIELLSRNSFDAVLMDCNMPVMDGYTATATIRKMGTQASNTPIIAMTANNSTEERDLCLSAGMNDFIAKPLSIDSLTKKLRHLNTSAPDPFLTRSIKKLNGTSMIYDFDESKIYSLQESVGEVFDSILEAFIEDTPIYLDSLKSAIEHKNLQQIYEISHTIKGSASNFGGNRVSELAKELEFKGKSGDLTGSIELLKELNSNSLALIDLLAKHVNNHSASSTTSSHQNEQLSVVIADDDRSTRLAFANNLRAEGYSIYEAANGQSVVAICARKMPNLIIMDAIMPELDGFEACKKIRAMSSGTDVPILMVTSLEDENSIAKAFNSGATDYISKPVNFSVFRQRVGRLLQTSQAQHHVRKLAYQDVLTGLPNRAYFNQQLRHRINRASINNTQLALLFLDLDRFKLINDSLGHDIGDLVLKSAADRIKNSLRKSDLVARFGGDEFTIILDDINSSDIAGEISRKIFDSLSQPFVFLKKRLFVSASIGIALFPKNGINTSELIKNADNAMYKAKHAGGGFRFFESEMEDEAVKRFEIENDIRTALSEDQFFLMYQPQYDLQTLEIRGVEALVRWDHPTKGIQPTSTFLSIAEDSGLISNLGSQVFDKACRQLKIWFDKGYNFRVSVNVSGVELQETKFSDNILTLIDKYNLPPHLLEIEITESMLMDQPEIAQKELIRLREKGISIAIDDFGSGFSSLIYLKNFSVDILKIDKEFVTDCDTNKIDQAIIMGIIALAKTLNLKIIAEGIERDEQMHFLQEAGCDFAQGYLLGRPVPLDELQLQLQTN